VTHDLTYGVKEILAISKIIFFLSLVWISLVCIYSAEILAYVAILETFT